MTVSRVSGLDDHSGWERTGFDIRPGNVEKMRPVIGAPQSATVTHARREIHNGRQAVTPPSMAATQTSWSASRW